MITDDDLQERVNKCITIEKLDLQDSIVTDFGMDCLIPCHSLSNIKLSPLITNEGMKTVVKFTSLKSLSIAGTEIDDDGLKEIGSLTELEFLHLNSGITDSGIEHLKNLKNLRSISFLGTSVGDIGLEIMIRSGSMQRLTELDLSTAMTDRAMVNIARLTLIERLVLVPSITDRGLFSIEGHEGIKFLMCSGGMTDKGLSSVSRLNKVEDLFLTSKSLSCGKIHECLPTMARLKRLFLPGHITEECKRALRGMMPNCSI